MRGPEPADDHSYLDGVLGLWRSDRNPLWIWIVIKSCIENGDPFPVDAIEYLNSVADRLLSDDAVRGHDLRKVLPGILGFRPQGRLQLRASRKMVEDEKYAVRFAVHILGGMKPSEARGAAWPKRTLPEDRTFQRKLRKFFGVDRAPNNNVGWRKVVILWMVKNRMIYRAQYPELPPLTAELINEVIGELPGLGENRIPFVEFLLSDLRISAR